jgi:uncharacterized protein YkwD
MARSKFRRAPRIENLEARELLSTVSSSQAPSNEAQYMLQVINLVRTNPQAAVQYIQSNITPDITLTLNHYGVDLNATLNALASSKAQPPVAWNAQLAQSAQSHSQDMATNGFQSHNGSDGSTPPQRMQAAGYTDPTSDGENVYAYAQSVDQAMEAFLLDWGVSDAGHRSNIQQPDVSSRDAYRDAGIGLVAASGPNSTGPLVVTQDFGAQTGEKAQVVGVVFNDARGTGSYAMGEGVGNVQLTAVNLATGQVSSTQTWASGGYELALDPGHYQLIASQNDRVIGSRTIDISNVNIEQDFNMAGSGQGGSLSDAISAAQPHATATAMAVSQPATPPPAPTVTVQATPQAAQAQPSTTQPAASPISWNWTSWTAKKVNG